MSQKSKKYTRATDTFITEYFGKKSIREMAEELGFSRSTVQRRVSFLGLNKEASQKEAGTDKGITHEISSRDSDTLTRLIELRDILYESLSEAGSNSKPRIASEYRAVLKDIHELELKENDDGRESVFDALFEEFGGKANT